MKDKKDTNHQSQTHSGGSGQGTDESEHLLDEQFRNTCISLLKELDFDLGEEYLQKYYGLKQMVAKTCGGEDWTVLRAKLLELVRHFAEAVFRDKEDAANFIAEVVTRLAELETHLFNSVEHTVNLQRERDSFTDGLVDEIDQVSDSVKVSDHIDDLRMLVLGHLDGLRRAIEAEREQEKQRVIKIKDELHSMRSGFKAVQASLAGLQIENKELATRIRIDPLTGCANRLALDERFADELARFQRHGRLFSLVMVDVDHFKKVNDSFGHQVGDNCLREVAHKLGSGLRRTDFLARFGGEEFILVLPESDLEQAGMVAEKQRALIQGTKFLVKGHHVPITVSMGVTQVQAGDSGLDSVLRRADKALYLAKDGGRNLVKLA